MRFIVVCVIGSVEVLLGFLHRVKLMSVYIVTWLRVGNCLPTMSYPSTFTAVYYELQPRCMHGHTNYCAGSTVQYKCARITLH